MNTITSITHSTLNISKHINIQPRKYHLSPSKKEYTMATGTISVQHGATAFKCANGDWETYFGAWEASPLFLIREAEGLPKLKEDFKYPTGSYKLLDAPLDHHIVSKTSRKQAEVRNNKSHHSDEDENKVEPLAELHASVGEFVSPGRILDVAVGATKIATIEEQHHTRWSQIGKWQKYFGTWESAFIFQIRLIEEDKPDEATTGDTINPTDPFHSRSIKKPRELGKNQKATKDQQAYATQFFVTHGIINNETDRFIHPLVSLRHGYMMNLQEKCYWKSYGGKVYEVYMGNDWDVEPAYYGTATAVSKNGWMLRPPFFLTKNGPVDCVSEEFAA